MKGRIFFIVILGLIMISGIVFYRVKKHEVIQVKNGPSFLEEEEVIIFLPDLKGGERKVIKVKGKKVEEKGEIIVEELKKYGIIPKEVKLYEMAKAKGLIYLNFSEELSLGIEDPFEEIKRVYGIVNSFLLTFEGAREVQILIEDSPVYTLSSLIYTLGPLKFNKTLEE